MQKRKIIYSVLRVLIVVVAFTGFRGLLNQYVADVYYEKSKSLQKSHQLDVALEYADKSIEKNPLQPRYRRNRAQVYIAQMDPEDIKLTSTLHTLAINDMTDAFRLNSNNIVTARNTVPLYYYLAVKDISLPGEIKGYTYKEFAEIYYTSLSSKYPNDVGVQVLIAKYARRLNLLEVYSQSVERINNLRPDLLDWYEGLK